METPDSKKRKTTFSPDGAPLPPVRMNSPKKRAEEIRLIVENMIKPLKNEIELLKSQLNEKNSVITNLTNDLRTLENSFRKKKLKMFGVNGVYENKVSRENEFDRKRLVMAVLRTSGINYHPSAIEEVTRDKYSALVVTFLHKADRDFVYAKREHIKSRCRVKVDQDFDEITEKNLRELRPIVYSINNLESSTHKASIKNNKLLIDNKIYELNNLPSEHNLPDEIRPENLFTKSKNNVTGFFKKHSPFSNHFHAPQTVNKITYNCNEQFFMHQKALTFRDSKTASEILKEKDPVRQKQLGKNIKDFDFKTWSNIRNKVMKDGLTAKFQQNKKLANFLDKTGTQTLVECNPHDNYWGIGLSLYDPNAYKSTNWTQQNKNHLGTLLMDIRRELRNNNKNTNG